MRVYFLMLSGLLTKVVGAEEPCVDCDLYAVAVEAAYTGEVWRQTSGGVATGTRYLDNLDVTLDVDAERLAGIEGMQLFAYMLYNNGHGFCDELTGSAQCVSNIEATEALRLYELWTQWRFGSGEQSLRFGLYDLNCEFDSIESAGLFINPSHGIGADLAQTGQNGPSIFPITGLGVRFSKTVGQWSTQVAVLDAVPGDLSHPDRTTIKLSEEQGALIIGEANYRWPSTRFGIGYWQYTAEFVRLDAAEADEDGSQDTNLGAYAILEQSLLTSETANIDVFIRLGAASARINPVDRYLGAGAVYTSSLNGREQQFGLAVAIANFGEPYRRLAALDGTELEGREYIVELTYRMNVSDWLAIQPDVQYIRHPSADPRLDAGWAVGLRFEAGSRWSW